ncbi:hypothetical protein Pmar_PMAR006749 [Perkinsus marinus ATCC 50983]|uniref:Uncharacterized protein n=1 Tax=Perkinsus marinus (strain ATCC 50983 / TXsc) TaxID=423536 RepID=C5K6D7_PERM5|nr:hypothetical protein Pmar_PMAR006749 [Perkinsus marinus ATCC 50983]EER19857.1 hypothetical protein Pmar_PMAR006749 [Perkinsus marinus ATCC 50983]|eukprot:XP_002788061.1 hypothetical protein Pmar_PMAR006749 [Perkinsus marinus ATCC 50983]
MQLVSVCCSLARLNIPNLSIISRSAEVICEMLPEHRDEVFGHGQDVAIAIYSFAKLRALTNPSLWPTLLSLFHHTVDGMVAAHLTMCVTAFKRVRVQLTPSLVAALNRRAMKVMAEFSATGLALFLRDVEVVSESLLSRVVMHLPRLLESASAEDVAVLVREGLLSVTTARPPPLAVLDVLRPFIIQFAGSFTDVQRLGIVESLLHHHGEEESVVEVLDTFRMVGYVDPTSRGLSVSEKIITIEDGPAVAQPLLA